MISLSQTIHPALELGLICVYIQTMVGLGKCIKIVYGEWLSGYETVGWRERLSSKS